MPKLAPWWPLSLSIAVLASIFLLVLNSPSSTALQYFPLHLLGTFVGVELIFRLNRKHLIQRISSDNPLFFVSYETGSYHRDGPPLRLLDSEFATVQLVALESTQVALAQAMNLGKSILSGASYLLMTLPAIVFWLAVIALAFEPTLITVIASATPEQIAAALPQALSVIMTLSVMILVMVMIVRGPSFGLQNCYREPILRALNQLDAKVEQATAHHSTQEPEVVMQLTPFWHGHTKPLKTKPVATTA